jgi:hypothetical protein
MAAMVPLGGRLGDSRRPLGRWLVTIELTQEGERPRRSGQRRRQPLAGVVVA